MSVKGHQAPSGPGVAPLFQGRAANGTGCGSGWVRMGGGGRMTSLGGLASSITQPKLDGTNP